MTDNFPFTKVHQEQLLTDDLRKPNKTVLELVGNTPLVRINNLTRHLQNVEIYAKLEGYNPGGSVKDRPVLQMVEDAESSGELTHDKVILDSTSGNTGIAYAWIGAVKGYKVELVMPLNVSEERKKIVKAFGAKITFSDPLEGSDGAILEARRLLKENSEKYFKPDQYNNPANSKAHYLTTGREVFEQTNGRVTHFIATIGTGGTIMGAGKRLKEFNSEVQVIAAEPEHPLHGIEGLKHMASSIVPGIYHENQLDGKIPIPTEEAYDVAKCLALEEGLFVGQSSGAAMWGALKLAKNLSDGLIVTVFPDGGDKYLSTALWD